MKIITLLISAALMCGPAFARGGGHSGGGSHAGASSHSHPGVHYVRSYTKKDGAYVQQHRQTNPDGTRNDNWSTRGNTNPNTGKSGTKPRDGEGPAKR